MVDNIIYRAEILIQQQKYTEAEKILKNALSTDPTQVELLALLAEVYLQLDRLEEALNLIRSALSISPDFEHLYFIQARVLINQDQYDEAERVIQHYISLVPSDPDGYALWASIKLDKKQFDRALELANKTLELDAENLLGLNIRSVALIKLNKKDEAYKTIEGALKEDPNNAYTHANYGWGLLETRQYKKALEHFREALKNNPNLPHAQAGMVEALKANNIFYKLFLRYAFWMSKLTAKYQWGVIIGFYLGFRLIRTVAASSDTLRPFLIPLIVLLTIVAFSTWVISPLSNLFLRLSEYGKYLLDEKETMSSNFVGASLALFLIAVLLYAVTGGEQYLPVAVFGFTMMLPFGVMFSSSKSKYFLVIYTALLALVGIGSIAVTFSTGELFNGFTPIFILGFVAFQWVANYFVIRESNI
ncbi:MAG: tetratricopeptide repeat protein [Microscillaceae bacterium]|nr:tetratricopeptide repeat protein [Microscillaceae bacterium]